MLIISIGLSMDALAVSMSTGASRFSDDGRAAFRVSLSFGSFQFLMPVVGWYLGVTMASMVASVDHWIAFGLLALVGFRMIRAGVSLDEKVYRNDPTKGLTLLMLSIATSIDAMAVGLSLALLRVKIWYPSAMIGATTASLSLLGVRMGKAMGSKFGKRMEIAGGIILVFIGLRILLTHLWG